MAELEREMTALEFGEWFEIWRLDPWANVPNPPEEEPEIDPLAFVKKL